MKIVMLMGLLLFVSSAVFAEGPYTARSTYEIMKNGKVVDTTVWDNTEGVERPVAYLVKYETFAHIYGGRAEDAILYIVKATSAATE